VKSFRASELGNWAASYGVALQGGRGIRLEACKTLGLLLAERVSCGPTLNLLNPTRLETRTKESNMCASIWVTNPDAKGSRFVEDLLGTPGRACAVALSRARAYMLGPERW
jgi:hypothetical protein